MQTRPLLKAYLIQDGIISKTQINLYERYSHSLKKAALFSIVEYGLTYKTWPGYPFWQRMPGILPPEPYHEALKNYDEIMLFFTCSHYMPEPSEDNWQEYKLYRQKLIDAGLKVSNLFICVEREDDLGFGFSKDQMTTVDIHFVTSFRYASMYKKYEATPQLVYLPIDSVKPSAEEADRMMTFGV